MHFFQITFHRSLVHFPDFFFFTGLVNVLLKNEREITRICETQFEKNETNKTESEICEKQNLILKE